MADAEIRLLGVGDEELLRSTRLHGLADAPTAFGATLAEAEARAGEFWTSQVRGRLGDHACATWVAVDSAGHGVGMLAGVEQPDAVDVIQVWVDPTWRGSGLIEELFGVLFAWAPHDRVDIAVAKSNIRARAVYERLGFKFVRERPGAHEIEIEMTQARVAPRF
ncbi:MAG: GNAT family N-acetyltransferase [Microthrixaceae bacterium]